MWIFGDSSQNLNKFQGVHSSLLSTFEEDDIQSLNEELRSTVNIFNKYHKVRYEKEELQNIRMSVDSGVASASMDLSIQSEADEVMETDSEDIQSNDSDDEDTTSFHCEKCKVVTSRIHGQEVEEETIGYIELPCQILEKLKQLVKDEKVMIEDIAIVCVDHNRKEHLIKTLPDLVCRKDGIVKQKNNLHIIPAEDFATKCSKLRKKGRKRNHSSDSGIQKKFLMIDTVRRFKGLEAEVVINFSLPYTV